MTGVTRRAASHEIGSGFAEVLDTRTMTPNFVTVKPITPVYQSIYSFSIEPYVPSTNECNRHSKFGNGPRT